jgi:hypothetical protein
MLGDRMLKYEILMMWVVRGSAEWNFDFQINFFPNVVIVRRQNPTKICVEATSWSPMG